MPEITRVQRSYSPRDLQQITGKDSFTSTDGTFDEQAYNLLPHIGAELPRHLIDQMAHAMDALPSPQSTPSTIAPIDFLRSFLPGFVNVITQKRAIDDLIGFSIVGKWEDEQIVQGFRDFQNAPKLYGDTANVPFVSTNINYVYRSIVRFEQGMQIDRLNSARAAASQIDLASDNRNSVAMGLEILRNKIGFSGFNGGANFTYGFLNEPNLPAYNTIPNGASGNSRWATKDFLEIISDMIQFFSGLRTQSGDTIDPMASALTLALPTSVKETLNTTNNFGVSVQDWLTKTYPGVRVVSAPELDAANGGANVAYLYADKVEDGSTDGGKVIDQLIQTKFTVLGVEQQAKGYLEDYTNATAGVIVRRPYGIYRATGL